MQKLVEASHYIEDIYWRQSDPEGLALYQRLKKSPRPEDKKVVRFLTINGSRFDLTDNNKPFVGDQPYSPDRGLYPDGVTREEIEKYVKDHPEKRDEIYNPYTVVRRNRDGGLEGIAYHVAYREFLIPAAKALREAAALSADQGFANFLNLRADALPAEIAISNTPAATIPILTAMFVSPCALPALRGGNSGCVICRARDLRSASRCRCCSP